MSVLAELTKENILSFSFNYINNDNKELTVHLKDLFNTILKYKDRYVHTDNDGDYFIEAIGDTIFIYFEESDSWADWMSNFDFLATTYKNTEEPWKCHRGFFRVWKTMKDSVEQKVEEIITSRQKIYDVDNENNMLINKIVCAGYSHGAALCGLCVEDMTYKFKDKYDINVFGYGFGCPKFTQSILPENVAKRFAHFYPIRNGSDLVTYVPPSILGYGHGYNGVLKIKPVNKYNCIDAHRPESYITELENLYTK